MYRWPTFIFDGAPIEKLAKRKLVFIRLAISRRCQIWFSEVDSTGTYNAERGIPTREFDRLRPNPEELIFSLLDILRKIEDIRHLKSITLSLERAHPRSR